MREDLIVSAVSVFFHCFDSCFLPILQDIIWIANATPNWTRFPVRSFPNNNPTSSSPQSPLPVLFFPFLSFSLFFLYFSLFFSFFCFSLVSNIFSVLQDPSIASSPLEKRVAFLRSKNLTQEEIDAALRRVGEAPPASTAVTTTSPAPSPYAPPQPSA